LIAIGIALGLAGGRLALGVLRVCGRRPRGPEPGPERFAVVSHAVPPMWSGQAMVLDRLLGELRPEQCVVIASCQSAPPGSPRNATILLPAEPWAGKWLKAGWRATAGVLARCWLRGWRIARIVARERCTGVVACTGDLIDLPAAAIACRSLGLPLVAYYFDDYVAQWSWAPAPHARAHAFEPFILRAARNLLVPNERLAEAVAERSARRPLIIRNPAWTDRVAEPPEGGRPAPGRCLIVYTGAVYHVNYAAFRCLIESFSELADLDPELHIYTAQDSAQLAQEGIHGPRVRVFPHVAPGLAWERQCAASVLFMGFAFDEGVAAVVRSSAPGKLGDYLASGVPIVALTPRASFLADYLAGHDCGEVVERLDAGALAAAIRTVVADAARRTTLVANARGRAREEFSASVAVRQLLDSLRPPAECAGGEVTPAGG